MSGVAYVPVSRRPVRVLGWGEVEASVSVLAERLALRGAPEALVGLFQGGWIVAQLLAEHFTEAAILGATSKRIMDDFESQLIGTEDDAPADPAELVRGRRVVLVDEVVESGRTMRFHAARVESLGAASMTCAALYALPGGNLPPDIWAEHLDVATNLILPWRHRRDAELARGPLAPNTEGTCS